MFRNRHSHRRRSPRTALAGVLFGGLMSTGCIVIEDSGARGEAEEVREDLGAAAEEFARSLSDAVEDIGEAMTELAEDLEAGRRVAHPLNFREFYPFLPDAVGDFRRMSRDGGSGGAFGIRVSAVEAEYEAASGAEVEVAIVDAGALPAVGLDGFAEWLDVEVDEESDRGWARTIEYAGYPAIESFERQRGDRGEAEFAWFVEGRFLVALEGDDVTIDELHDLRDAIDIRGLADLRDREGN